MGELLVKAVYRKESATKKSRSDTNRKTRVLKRIRKLWENLNMENGPYRGEMEDELQYYLISTISNSVMRLEAFASSARRPKRKELERTLRELRFCAQAMAEVLRSDVAA